MQYSSFSYTIAKHSILILYLIEHKLIFTALPPPICGIDCNKTIIITSDTASGVYHYDSVNWGYDNYVEDCTCVLNVEVSFYY